MGASVKYDVKQLAMSEFRDQLLPIEESFYERLEARVMLIPTPEPDAQAVWRTIEAIAVAGIFGTPDLGNFHLSYRGVRGDSSVLDTRDGYADSMAATAQLRKTLRLKVAGRSCIIEGDAAFAVFDYDWEFTGVPIDRLKREIGTFAYTLVRKEDRWSLLGSSGGPQL